VLVSLSCRPTPKVTWTRLGKDFTSRVSVTREGFGTEIEIKEPDFDDSGTYRCRATNSEGDMGDHYTDILLSVVGTYHITHLLTDTHTGTLTDTHTGDHYTDILLSVVTRGYVTYHTLTRRHTHRHTHIYTHRRPLHRHSAECRVYVTYHTHTQKHTHIYTQVITHSLHRHSAECSGYVTYSTHA